MDEFFQTLKDNLENRPEPPFDENDWKDMDRRLKESPLSGSGGAFWRHWLALPLVLLFLGMLVANLLMYRQIIKANRQMAAFEHRTQPDTIFRTRVIYQTDTVFHTRVIREQTVIESEAQESRSPYYTFGLSFEPDGEAGASYFSVPPSSLPTEALAKVGVHRFIGSASSPNTIKPPPRRQAGMNGRTDKGRSRKYAEELSLPVRQPLLVEFLEWKARKTDLAAQQPQPSGEALRLPPAEQLLSLACPPLEVEPPDAGKYLSYRQPVSTLRKDPFRFVQVLRPKKVHLGVIGGYAAPLRAGLTDRKGYAVGIFGAVDFSERIRLWAEVSHLELRYQTTEMDDNIGVPPVDPPLDDFIFKKAVVVQPSYQYAVGLQYSWPLGSGWAPYAGLGYSLIKRTPYEIFYEFDNDQLGLEWVLEEGVETRKWLNNLLLARGGIAYRMNKLFTLQLEGFYRTQMGEARPEAVKAFGVRGGAMYRF